MAKVVAIANQKGGVGKTTTAVNLAASLAVAEQRILIIDGDPQGNASSGIGIPRETIDKTIYEVLIGAASLEEVTHRAVQFKHLDVAPATADLAAAEVELVDQPDRDRTMRNAIGTLRDRYDYVLIDCPPSLGLITINMLVAADSILIPVQCEYYALEGLSQLLNTVNLVQRSANPSLKIEGVLLTMYDARLNLSRQVAADAREFFGPQVFETVIPRNIRLAEAPSFGKPIVVYDIASVGAQTYMGVARELILRNSPIPPPAVVAQAEVNAVQPTLSHNQPVSASATDGELPTEHPPEGQPQTHSVALKPFRSLVSDAPTDNELASPSITPSAGADTDAALDSAAVAADPKGLELENVVAGHASPSAELVVFESTTIDPGPTNSDELDQTHEAGNQDRAKLASPDDPTHKPNLESSLGSA